MTDAIPGGQLFVLVLGNEEKESENFGTPFAFYIYYSIILDEEKSGILQKRNYNMIRYFNSLGISILDADKRRFSGFYLRLSAKICVLFNLTHHPTSGCLGRANDEAVQVQRLYPVALG